MVSIKEATERAVAFAREVLGNERTTGVRLEEIESTTEDGEDAWLITLSMRTPFDESEDFTAAITDPLGTRNRQYKSFIVHKQSGEVKAMRIRKLAGA